MIIKRGRYSGLIRPISYAIDLLIICILARSFFKEDNQYINFIIFISVFWIIVSVISKFYEIYRYTKLVKIISLIAKQSVIFTLLVFAFFGYFKDISRSTMDISKYVIYSFILITIFKLTIYYLLKKDRKSVV